MPQFLYRIRPARAAMLVEGPTPRELERVQEHLVYLQELAARGVVFLAGRTQTADEHTFGIVVFAAESEEAARRLMQEDPVVRHGVMRAELFPYRIAAWSPPPPEPAPAR